MKVVVFGLGRDFEVYKEILLNEFDVVACCDNHIIPTEEYWKACYIRPELLSTIECDWIIVCSRKYYEVIRVQLVRELGISYRKIVSIEKWLSVVEGEHCFRQVLKDMSVYDAYALDAFKVEHSNLLIKENDRTDNAGKIQGHYFAQDIWGGKKIYNNKPRRHFDIGSRLDGFIAHLLVFREVYYIDIRPLPYEIKGLHFIQGDATELKELEDKTLESLSSFHALEHFGLGRYGDVVDNKAYIKAAKNMIRVLKPGGRLYIGVPVGPKDKCVFNAHRIFRIETILDLFEGLQLVDIALVRPNGAIAEPIKEAEYLTIEEYSCGLFEFVKPN